MTFTVSGAKTRPENLETFVLNRGGVSGKAVDLFGTTDYHPVSYSNATMALVSLMKDAYWNEARIRVTGQTPQAGPGPAGLAPADARPRLEKVEFMERYGPVVEAEPQDDEPIAPIGHPDFPIDDT